MHCPEVHTATLQALVEVLLDLLLPGAVGGKPHRQLPSCGSGMHPSILPCLQGL